MATACSTTLLVSDDRPVAHRTPAGQALRETDDERTLATLMRRYGCTSTGLADGQIPGGAIVLGSRAGVRHVSFDYGWSVYEGRRKGTLLAVCER